LKTPHNPDLIFLAFTWESSPVLVRSSWLSWTSSAARRPTRFKHFDFLFQTKLNFPTYVTYSQCCCRSGFFGWVNPIGRSRKAKIASIKAKIASIKVKIVSIKAKMAFIKAKRAMNAKMKS
jgi:hypothetical protein